MLIAKGDVLSDSVFCTGPGFSVEKRFSDIWKKKAELWLENTTAARTESTLQVSQFDIEWHVHPGVTCVQTLQKLKVLTSETGDEPQNFPGRIIFASMFDDIPSRKSSKNASNMSGSS